MAGQFEIQVGSPVISLGQTAKLKSILLCLFIGIVLIYLAFLKPGIWGVDGNDMLHMSQSLILKGNLTVPPSSGGVLGHDGQYYSIRYPLLSILATPFVAVGLFLGSALGVPVQYASATCALVLNILLTAATAVLVFLITLQLGGQRRGAYLASLGFVFGTTALVYAREFFAEPLLGFIITLALYLAFQPSRRAHLGASGLAALAIVAKPAGILLGPVLAVYFLSRRYAWWQILAPGVGSGIGVGLYLLYNFVRFGSFLSSGQDSSQFTFDGFAGRALGQLVSPGAGGGMFLYSPPTILALVGFWLLWRRRKSEGIAVFGIILGFWLLHSCWSFNGWNWGPRFLVPIIPALMVCVGLLDRRWRMPLVGLTILGFAVNAPTLVAFYQRYYAEMSDLDTDVLMQTLALWGEPSQSPLLNIWSATYRQLQAAFSTPVQTIIADVGKPPELGQLASAELLRIVAVWWWFLPAVGIPVWVGGLMALALVLGGIGLIRWAWQQTLAGDQTCGQVEVVTNT